MLRIQRNFINIYKTLLTLLSSATAMKARYGADCEVQWDTLNRLTYIAGCGK